MRKTLKIVSLVVAITMLALTFVGCGESENNAVSKSNTEVVTTNGSATTEATQSSKELVKLVALQPGDESAGMQSFLKGPFKQKIKDDLNIEMEVNWSPWDQYWQKLDMMIAAGENLDWYWSVPQFISKTLAQKAYSPLNDALEKYGQNLKKVIPEDNFKAFTFDGKLVCIPTAYAPSAELFNSLLVRQDILESVGMTDIKSLGDLEQFINKSKEKYPEMKALSSGIIESVRRELDDNLKVYANDFISIDIKTNKAECWFLTDTFKKVAENQAKYNKMGYFPEEVTLKPGEAMGRMATGQYLVCSGAISRPLENINDLRKNVPEGKYKEYVVKPELGKAKFIASSNFIVVGPKSKNVDRVVEFVDWIYKSKDNYNFFLYGVKDVDYKIENNRLKQINKDSLFYEWMFRNVNLMDFPDSVDDSFIDTFKNWDNGATIPDFYGFIFDATPVNAELSKMNTVNTEKFLPFSTGFIDFDKNYDSAVKALKDAGVDKYVAEYQKQLDAYIASKK